MFTLYSKDNCSYCTRAKILLKQKDFNYTELKVTENPVGSDEVSLEDFRVRLPNAKTVPQIFHDETHIGGYADLKSYLETIWPTT